MDTIMNIGGVGGVITFPTLPKYQADTDLENVVTAYLPDTYRCIAIAVHRVSNVPNKLDKNNPSKVIIQKEDLKPKFSNQDGVIEFLAFAFEKINGINFIHMIVSKDNVKTGNIYTLQARIDEYCFYNKHKLFFEL